MMDPIGFAGGFLNTYLAYGNNPVTFTDPSGLEVYLGLSKVIREGKFLGYHVTIYVGGEIDCKQVWYQIDGVGKPDGQRGGKNLQGPFDEFPDTGTVFIVASKFSDADDVRRLKAAYERMNPVPYYPEGPNSNTFAHQLLINAGYSVPKNSEDKWVATEIRPEDKKDPVRRTKNPQALRTTQTGPTPSTTWGWKLVDGYVYYSYGGLWYDRHGNSTPARETLRVR
jgi:hypothetical protein